MPSRKSGEFCCNTWHLISLFYTHSLCSEAAVVRGVVCNLFLVLLVWEPGGIVLSVNVAMGLDLVKDLCTEVRHASSWWSLGVGKCLLPLHAARGDWWALDGRAASLGV